MPDCSILRIGPIESENDNSTVLRNAIISHFQDGASTEASSSSPLSTNPNSLLTISNRYFDANVLLLGLGESNNNNIGGETTIGPQEDGILLIFNASLSTSFDSLAQFHSTAMQNDQAGELIRLCIGATYGPSPLGDGSKKSEEEYSRRVLWCLDHGYEYVEVDLTVEGMARGHDERDKDGFARVVEAVGSCMWSSHVMKKRGGGVGGAAGVGLMASLAKNVPNTKESSGESQSESQSNATEKEKVEIGTTATLSSANDVEREKAAMASLMQDMNNTKPATESNDNPPKEEENTQQQNHQEEMSIHQIESIISQAKLIREASKNNSMSDEERRERAGDTAMKLMGLLDSLGFDEDTEDEGGCSSDEEEGC